MKLFSSQGHKNLLHNVMYATETGSQIRWFGAKTWFQIRTKYKCEPQIWLKMYVWIKFGLSCNLKPNFCALPVSGSESLRGWGLK